MDKTEKWVVYRMTINKKGTGMNAVCEESEWEAIELGRPGYHSLIQAGIASEGEAERLARNTPVDRNPSQSAELAPAPQGGLVEPQAPGYPDLEIICPIPSLAPSAAGPGQSTEL
jgi:hypothetical protein